MTSSRRRPLRRLTGLLFIIILASGAFALWVRKTVTAPIEHESADRIVTIDQGAGTQGTVARLAEAGIVPHPLALKLYLRITGKGSNLKAGDYKFPSPISPLQAIEKIRRGEVYLERVTLPQSFNPFELPETFASKTRKATTDGVLRLIDYQTT